LPTRRSSDLQRLEGKALGVTGCYLGHCGTTARASHGMEVHRVDMRAVLGVLQVDVDGIAYAHPQHRARDSVVEGPELVAGAVTQPAFHLGGFQVEGDRLRSALAHRLAHLSRVLGQIGELAASALLNIADDQLAEHTSRLVT